MMSTAEIAARNFYDTYNVGALTEDVKRQLIILMLSNKYSDNISDVEEMPQKLTKEQLYARIAEAEQDILNENTIAAEDMESHLESKYPWLCK